MINPTHRTVYLPKTDGLGSIPQQTPRNTPVSASRKLASLGAPSSSQSAWQKAQATSGSMRSSSSKHRPTGESFVLLQDSVIHKIPSDVSKPKGATQKSKARAATPTQASSRKQPAADKQPTTPVATSPTTKPPPPPAPPRSHHLAQTLKLYTLLSNRTDLDHPLCAECTSVLITTLTKQLEETKRERDGYIAFERDVRSASGTGDVQAMEAQIEELKLEEKNALDELFEAEREKARLDRELEELEREEQELEEKEAEYVTLSTYLRVPLTIPVFCTGSGAFTTLKRWPKYRPPPLYAQFEQHTKPTQPNSPALPVLMYIMMHFALGTTVCLGLSMDSGWGA
jgi:beclin 1